MIVLTDEPGEAEKLAGGAPGLQRRYGMPIDPAPYPRASSSEPACLAVVTARLDDPAAADRLLRRLRVRRMAGGLLDDPALIDAAAQDAGLDPAQLRARSQSEEARDALAADRRAARAPTKAAHALKHRLGGAHHVLRYVAPSYELVGRRWHVLDPRLQSLRGLRDGAREPRPVARAPGQAARRRRGALVGAGTACDCRDRRAARRRRAARAQRARGARAADGRRRRLLLAGALRRNGRVPGLSLGHGVRASLPPAADRVAPPERHLGDEQCHVRPVDEERLEAVLGVSRARCSFRAASTSSSTPTRRAASSASSGSPSASSTATPASSRCLRPRPRGGAASIAASA